MKKTIAKLLVAIMAVGSAFAAFSGSAQVGVGANFDNGDWGFIGNSTNVKFDVELATENVENVSEGDIYASVKASFGLKLMSDEDGIGPDGDPLDLNVGSLSDGSLGFGIIADITEAKIGSANWYVSLLGLAGVNDFAKSAIDTWTVENEKNDYGAFKADYDKNATYKVGYVKAPGVEVGIADYVIGAGFWADAQQTPDVDLFAQYAATAYFKTPEYDFNGLGLQAGAVYSLSSGDADKSFSDKKDSKAYNAAGASLKLSYANDTLSASVASDLGYDFENKEFGADVAANFTYDFLTFDAYYGTNPKTKDDGTKIENLLSAQVVTDLNSFDVPVKVTVSGKDLINKQDLDLSVEFKVASLTLTPSVGYVIGDEKFNAGLKAQYDHEYFTAKAATSVETGFDKASTTLKASASIENSTLIPGSTIKLEWKDAEDLLNNSADHEKNYGKVIASIKVEF